MLEFQNVTFRYPEDHLLMMENLSDIVRFGLQ